MIPIIEIRSLSTSFKNKEKIIHALQDVSLTVEKGDVYGIIGLSGAGKSTLIRSLAHLIPPTSGKVLFHGKDLAKMKREDLRAFHKSIGMIFQHFNLLSSRTVGENVSYPLEISQASNLTQTDRVDELLEWVKLKEKKNIYPSQLSGGEKQRVGIARALANVPELLLCDEATSALDPKTSKEILALLKEINKKGVTIILITHQMEVIKEICNKVAVIDKGCVVEEGLVSEIFAEPKHPITKSFLQSATHEIPSEFFKITSPDRKLLRLRFKGEVASEPIMSQIVRKFNIETNILMGWLDRLQNIMIGTLIVELTGNPQGIAEALNYLHEKSIPYEVIENEL